MEYLPEVTKLVELGLQGNSSKILGYTKILIEKLEKAGDSRSAKRLKDIIMKNKAGKISPNSHVFKLKSPVDSESRLPLTEIEKYEKNSIFLAVPNDLEEDLIEFSNLIVKSKELKDKNLIPNLTLLMYGPPGSGKTQAARYIASKVDLPLVSIRIDGLISSYLGSTSKNIRTLFDFVKTTPCILFLDEFDAIAKKRDDSYELGELKRVVNTLLQNIDSLYGKIPIIAATNHQHLLDPAVWRRFQYKIYFDLPNQQQRKNMIKEFLKENATQDLIEILIVMTENLSGADIELFCNIIKTNLLLEKIDQLNERTLFQLFIKYKERSEQNRPNYIDSENRSLTLAKSFRERNKKIFDYRTLSKMLGVSLGKISKMFKSEV